MPMPLPLPGAPQIPLAVSIAPADTADTTVLDPRPEEQASLGAVALREHADIVYQTFRAADGGVRELKLDILRPATTERLPLLVYLPGGGFIFASKENAPVLRSFLAESGFVVASIEYRTVSDQATYVDSVHDTRQAVAYLRAHADDYGIDPHAAGLWGESAGGYVAAMTGVTNDTDRFSSPGPAGRVDAVVDSFGPSDLSATGLDFDEGFQSFYRDQPTQYSAYLGAPGRLLSEIPEAVHAADPASYASVTAPPFLLLHGTDDMLVSPSQTQHLHQALLAAGADSTRYLLAGANHGDLTFLGFSSVGRPWLSTTTLGLATGFLHRHLDRP